MQYWGIFVSMMTFIIDIYMTLSEDTKNDDKNEGEEILDEQN